MTGDFSNSADALLVLLFVVTMVIFFFFGPHKAYESILGVLIGIGFYLFIHEATVVFPESTRTILLGNWMVENKETLLWASKILIIALFFIAPISVGMNVAGVVRGTIWFFGKTIFLAAFIICFGTIIISFLSSGEGIFGEGSVLPVPLSDIPYFQNSHIYMWLIERRYIILCIGFFLGLYKILFSHWMGRLFLLSGLIYTKGNAVFSKKQLDSIVPTNQDNEGEGGEQAHH